MDPTIHFLVPISLLFLFIKKSSIIHREGIFLLMGSLIPDIDIILDPLSWFFPELYFFQHRGIGHSIFGGIILSVIFGYLLTRKKIWSLKCFFDNYRNEPPNFSYLNVSLVLFGVLLHIFIDFLTPFGPMILFPLTNQRFTIAIIKSIDFIVLLPSMVAIFYIIYLRIRKYDINRSKIFVYFFMIIFVINISGRLYLQTNVASTDDWNYIEATEDPFAWKTIKWQNKPNLFSFSNQTYNSSLINPISKKYIYTSIVHSFQVRDSNSKNIPSYFEIWNVLRFHSFTQLFFNTKIAPVVRFEWNIDKLYWYIALYDALEFLIVTSNEDINKIGSVFKFIAYNSSLIEFVI